MIDLIVQIRIEGFSIYCNNQFCAFMAHRRDLTRFKTLLLSIPVLDDNGNSECLILHKVSVLL